MFIHAMGNAQVMFQFVTKTEVEAVDGTNAFTQHLINFKVIDSVKADVDIDIGVDQIDGFILTRMFVWVSLDKLPALHTFAAMIPLKVHS